MFTINCATVVVVALGVARTVVDVVVAATTVVDVVEVDEVEVVEDVGGLDVIVNEIEVAVAAP